MRPASLFVFGFCGLVPCVQADGPDFAHDVVPILKRHCVECHTGPKPKGGFSISTRHLILESGHIDPAKPDKSRLLRLVRSVDPEDQMPPSDRPRLSKEESDVLTAWVTNGVKWEDGFRFGGQDYEPPLLPRLVNLPLEAIPGQNPIDRLLTDYYSNHQITAPEPASDLVFLRRVYMDLIGLPPTIDEQEQFQRSQNKDRRKQLVQQLLTRDRDYAEHWISFWNDLLRNDYAGTGYIDGGRKQITQWLYSALVNNQPYDQFVRALIAPTPESEGFINGIKWRGNVNASQVREIQFAQSVSQVFLGINMKCASCHDSFIDRWTLDEAYGLAAIYSKRELQIHRCDKPVGRVAKAAWIFPELGEVDPAAEQPERLKQLAAVMTSERNGRFSRTIVNRLWHRLLGHGIVHPVDAMHTRPWNEDLLDYLANYLVESKYDLKAVLAIIASSDAYRAAAAPARDSATGREYVFRGPESRHLTAEQFMDSVWRITRTAPTKITAPVSKQDYFGDESADVAPLGQWVWTYAAVEQAAAGEQATFRKTLALDKKPQSAALVITCDNEYTAYVNGKKIGADKTWPTVETLNIAPQLRVGNNEIRIVGRNAGNGPNAAALFAEIILITAEGEKIRIPSDETWQASRDVSEDQDADAVEWQAAVPVTNQGFLGPGIVAEIKQQLSLALSGTARHARASLLRSNMLMRSLGRPNREQIVSTRPASLSTLQAIDLANGEILDSMLAAGARKLLPDATMPDEFIRNLFLAAVCREPTDEELRLAETLLSENPSIESVQDLLWLLVMLPEFQFVQ